MKYTLQFFMIMIAMVIMRCSEEQIEPALLEEDPSTHMEAYYPSTVFAIEVTTILGGGGANGLPQSTEFYLRGNPGAKVSVNWGDGTIQKVTLDDASDNYMSHQYGRIKNYNIQISGEISKITTFGMYYQHIIIRNVYLAGLVNLKRLNMGLNYRSPSVVNLSHNRKIETIDLSGSSELTDIIIPSENRLRTVLLSGPNALSTAVVDRIISRVYTSVLASPRAGHFGLNTYWDQEAPEMVGPPSNYSITKLKKLRDVYGWEIVPSLGESSANAVTFQPSATEFNMWMEFTGKGVVTLDWGNGETEVIDFDVDPENLSATAYRYRGQAYATSIPPAKITGDIHLLVSILFENSVDALNTAFATGLQSLFFTDTEIANLNLSLNNELRQLNFDNVTIGELVLPQQHTIRMLSITPGELGPKKELVDYMISNIYTNTVAGNRMHGFIELNGAPISSESETMMEDLRNTYGWEIVY